jgi:hypothetical protein
VSAPTGREKGPPSDASGANARSEAEGNSHLTLNLSQLRAMLPKIPEWLRPSILGTNSGEGTRNQ